MTRPPSYASGLRIAAIVCGLRRRPMGWALDDIATRLEIHRRTVDRYAATLASGDGIAIGVPPVERCEVGDRPGLRMGVSP